MRRSLQTFVISASYPTANRSRGSGACGSSKAFGSPGPVSQPRSGSAMMRRPLGSLRVTTMLRLSMIGDEAASAARRAAAAGARDLAVGRAGRAFHGGAGDEQEDALDVFRQIGREGDRAVPFRPVGRRRIDAGAGDREAAAEGVEVQRLAGDAADAAADEEILIQHGDRAEGGFGIGRGSRAGSHRGRPRARPWTARSPRLGFRRGGRPRAGELGQKIVGRGSRRRRRRAARHDRAGRHLVLAGLEDEVAGVLLRLLGQGHELEGAAAGRGLDLADADRQRAARQRGAKRHEMAALEVAEHLGLPALHAQKIGGAGHVDVEEGAAHEEVRGFRRHVLGELGEALGGDDAGEPALAARGT